MIIFFTAAIDSSASLNVSFDKSTYNIDEGDVPVKAMLILSGESMVDVTYTVWVNSEDNSATGEYKQMLLTC